MSKLYGLKGWYSIAEAAERLSKCLGELVTEANLIQLAAEGHVKVCWFLSGEHYGQPVLVGCGYPKEGDVEIFSEIAHDEHGHAWGKSLAGLFTLPVDLCPSWGWWLLTFVGKGGESGSFCGPIVIEDDGTAWELYDHKTPASDFFHFPRRDEVVFRREDLQDFERSVLRDGTCGNGATIRNGSDYVVNVGPGEQRVTSLAYLLTPEGLSDPISAKLLRKSIDRSTDEDFKEAFDGATKAEALQFLSAYELCAMPYWGAHELATAIHAADFGRDIGLALRAIELAQKMGELQEAFKPQNGVEWAMQRGYLFGVHCSFLGIAPGNYGHPHTDLIKPVSIAAQAPFVADKHVSKLHRQREAILAWLTVNGYPPTNLPVREPGKRGPRAAARAALLLNKMLFTESSFTKAWEDLRADGTISGAE